MASGAGKTHTIAYHMKQSKPKSVLYVSHRTEINNQSMKIFKDVIGPKIINDYTIGIIDRFNKDFYKPFLFATVQTLSRMKNFERLNHGRKIDTFIIDEYHHAGAPSYKAIIENIKHDKLYGLTATPRRMDREDILKPVNNVILGNIDIFEAIEKKIDVPFHYLGIHDNVDWSDIRAYKHRYRIMDLDRKLLIVERDEKVISEYKEKIQPENVSTIAFCATKRHVERMVQKFTEAGIKNVKGIHYRTSLDTRKKIIDDFRYGTVPILFTVDILNEGVDFPECGALMMLRPTMSRNIFEQQLGRGLRKRKGKKRLLVLDFISNYENAYKIKEYLSQITRQSIKVKGHNYKPIYNLSVPLYEFEPKVISMMELQEKMRSGFYNKEQLINNFLQVKRKLNGKVPTYNQMNDRSISIISTSSYEKNFGTYNKFLESIGENPNHIPKKITNNHDLKYCKNEYFSKKKELCLSKGDFISQTKWTNNFGHRLVNILFTKLGITWIKFLIIIGEKNIRKCGFCNQKFENTNFRTIRRFCSNTCAMRNEGHLKKFPNGVTIKCIGCEKEFETTFLYKNKLKNSRRFCSGYCCRKYHRNNKKTNIKK